VPPTAKPIAIRSSETPIAPCSVRRREPVLTG
jgi:hypothetical protein